MKLMRESWILMGICLLDLASTLTLVAGRSFAEGTPLMSFYLDMGVWAFVGAKLVLVVMPLVLAEYSRQFRPAFVKGMLRFAIVAYLATYVTLFAGFNLKALAQDIVGPHTQTSTVAQTPVR